ncbi:MAG TPA: hypothetical protein VLF21_00415 [Candidatus Saccharimonadales bacterium]|nr:hypothetical protein [Candidatus Saccharimonadales bacterium]
MKHYLAWAAVILTFVAYIPYFRDILRRKTHPHLYSWSIWGLLTVIIFALQLIGGAGPGAFVTLMAGSMCFIVIILSLRYGKRDITLSDTIVLILTLITIALWLVAKQPVASIILATLADLLAFVPTVRKSWNKPRSETLSLYATNAARFGITALALDTYSLLTALWPIAWAVVNGLFALMLVYRRRRVRG